LHNIGMPNLASFLKDEIARVARKEVRSEVATLKKAATTHRAEIAALKRRALDLEKEIRALGKTQRKATPPAPSEESAKSTRFSAKGLASQRKRLALSAEDAGLLVGASGQSIYNWEAGKARPRTAHMAAISGLKTLGKKEANARLGVLRGASGPVHG
jgi:DNA-binding XRE family transcriptional regulator